MLLLELSISPLDKGESVGAYVARAVDVIDKSGLAYRLNPMGTVIEGEWDEVMAVVKKCVEALRQDCRRLSISMKADWREGQQRRLDLKVARVESALGRKIRT